MGLILSDTLYLGTATPGSGGGGSGLPDQTGHSGEFLTTDGTDASWAAVSGGSLPSQTGNAGKFLTTDGTDASWSDKPLVNTSESITNSFTTQGATAITQWGNSTAIGIGANANNSGIPVAGYNTACGAQATATSANCSAFGAAAMAVKMYSNAFGRGAYANGNGAFALGTLATVNANNAIQLNASASGQTNSDANTFKVANANGNFEMMSADGTIPAARLASTTGLADGNYRLRLTMASGVPTLTWVAE